MNNPSREPFLVSPHYSRRRIQETVRLFVGPPDQGSHRLLGLPWVGRWLWAEHADPRVEALAAA